MSRLKGGTVADRTTETWSGRPAFILASIGAAVGLGNIWKFPYTLGNSGGSAFVLIYVLAMLLIATPIMLSEMIIGRHARMSAPSALRTVAVENGSSPWWQAVGWMGQLVQLLVLSFYSVIAGWTMAYLVKSVSGGLHGLTPAEIGRDFDAFLHDPAWMVLWHFLFTGISHGPAFFGFGLGDFLIRLGPVRLKLGANILSHINISDINGKDFKRRTRVKPFFKNAF